MWIWSGRLFQLVALVIWIHLSSFLVRRKKESFRNGLAPQISLQIRRSPRTWEEANYLLLLWFLLNPRRLLLLIESKQQCPSPYSRAFIPSPSFFSPSNTDMTTIGYGTPWTRLTGLKKEMRNELFQCTQRPSMNEKSGPSPFGVRDAAV